MPELFKVVLIGNASVGKTQMLKYYTRKSDEDYAAGQTVRYLFSHTHTRYAYASRLVIETHHRRGVRYQIGESTEWCGDYSSNMGYGWTREVQSNYESPLQESFCCFGRVRR